MKVVTKFDIGQMVYIKNHGYHPARVTVIKVSGEPNQNHWYELEYWTETDLKVVTLSEGEIVAEIPKKESGFKP